MTFDVEKWQLKRKKKSMEYAKKMQSLADFLISKGYKYIVVHYQGCGDSGESFEAEGYKTKKSFIERDQSQQWKPNGNWNNETSKFDPLEDEWEGCTRNQENIDKLVVQYNEKSKETGTISDRLIDIVDYDWYNNEGGQGQVIFHLEEGIILVDGEQNTSACYDVLERYYLDGKDPEFSYDPTGRITN